MSEVKDIVVPDIGGAEDVDVIEIMVNPGDSFNADDSLITLESDKASMEVPAPYAGTVKALKIKVGDKVSEGSLILTAEVATQATTAPEQVQENTEPAVAQATTTQAATPAAEQATTTTSTQEVSVPDIGGAEAVDVIEVSVSAGDTVVADDSLITLESDKASMEIPSPYAGTIKDVKIRVGDKVSQGSLILVMEATQTTATSAAVPASASTPAPATNVPTSVSASQATPAAVASTAVALTESSKVSSGATIYAGPAVRRVAREFGVDLRQVKGTGRRGRILKEDIQAYVKGVLSGKTPGAASGNVLGVELAPVVDFSKFGEIEKQPLNKIKRLTGKFLHRNWVTIPHVTQFDEADITVMEEFRQENKAKAAEEGVKLTPIAFVIKAVVASLKAYPVFNSSLDAGGENLILKHYYNVGVAVDTPNGLVVPVIRNVDQKSLFDLARELGDISKKAREKGLAPADMQGGCFSISSLGGIGGTAFTPIVNLPEVAILGLSRSYQKPVYHEGAFVPRLTLPLSLSYDHRVIDGADAARFVTDLSANLADIRRLLL